MTIIGRRRKRGSSASRELRGRIGPTTGTHHRLVGDGTRYFTIMTANKWLPIFDAPRERMHQITAPPWPGQGTAAFQIVRRCVRILALPLLPPGRFIESRR